ncbi:MAG: transposase [Pseudomonadales bacterium]
MSRPVRIEFPGANYYVTSRGLNDKLVFKDNEDRAVFLNVLAGVVERFNWLLHSYVMLDSHYHLVVECPKANLSKGMRQLNGVYTQHFNRRHEDDGPLFQGRFRSVLFEPTEYLLPLCRHAVMNPVRLELAGSAQQYRWSSHRAMAGQIQSPAFLTTDRVLGHFGKREKDNQKKYKEFVKAGATAESPLNERSGQVLLGSPKFIAEMQPILNGEKLAKRGPKRAQRRRSLPVLFKNIDNKTRVERNELIRKAHIDHSYTLMEIGEFLGLHYTTVSKVVNR